jgi:intein/homing endonuclease
MRKIKKNKKAIIKYFDIISLALINSLDNRKEKLPDFSNIVDIDESFAGKAPRTKDQLAVYCATVLNNKFPYPRSKDKYCIENNHMSPLDALWGAYSEQDPFSIWYAMRGSGKTRALAILGWLESVFKPNCWTTVLGGSLEQSIKAVSYTNELWNMQTVTHLRNKLLVNGQVAGRGFKTTHGSQFQALAASTKSIRGPHPQKLRLDECLDENTLIQTNRGNIKIKDIIRNDKILCWDGCKITNGVVLYNSYVGKKETYKIIIENGKNIYATLNHKFLTTKGFLYLYEIIRRQCKGESIYFIGESKDMSKVWENIEGKKKKCDRLLQKLLYTNEFKQKKSLYKLRKRNRKKFNSLSRVLFQSQERKKIEMRKLRERIKTTRNSKVQRMLFKTIISNRNEFENGKSESNSFEKKSIKGRDSSNGIARLHGNKIQLSSSLQKICSRFYVSRFESNNRNTWSVLARKKASNRKRFKKERNTRKRWLQGFRAENRKNAFLDDKNYGIFKLIKIEKDRVRNVYDLHVPEFHSFIANGIMVHNCDEMDPKIYQGSLGQPKSNYGILDNVIISSTLHNAFGLMSDIIDKREELGAKLYAWCINEVLQPRGFWTKEEFNRRVKQLTIAMLEAEYLLKRPKIGDTIFDFESVDRAYQRGKNETYQPKVYTEAGIDWGYACTALSMVQDPREVFRNNITKIWEYVELKERCNAIADLCIKYNIVRLYCDSNPKDSNMTLKKTLREKRVNTEVIPIAFNKWKGVGINVIRFLLEKNKLNITDKTAQEKVKKYHYKDPELGIIEKKDDHIPDSLIAWATSRYRILGI